MSKRRMLNQDYFKLDAKNMRHVTPSQNPKQTFRLLEVKLKSQNRYIK